MNWDQIEGNWKQFKGKVKEKWGKLTDDQLDQLAGNRDQLVGKLQEQYGISKEEAEKQLGDWASRQAERRRRRGNERQATKRSRCTGALKSIDGRSRCLPPCIPLAAAVVGDGSGRRRLRAAAARPKLSAGHAGRSSGSAR